MSDENTIRGVLLQLDRYAGGVIFENDPCWTQHFELKDYALCCYGESLVLLYNRDVYTQKQAVELLKELYLEDMTDEERERNNRFEMVIAGYDDE